MISAVEEYPETVWEEFVELERDDVYLPSPEEIVAACQEIQSSWSESDRARRARGQEGRRRHAPVSSKRYVRLLLDKRDMDDRAA